jgi:hypothetical protein
MLLNGSFTFSALAQCFSTISQAAHPEHNPHASSMDSYRSPVAAMNGQMGSGSLPTTYATVDAPASPSRR